MDFPAKQNLMSTTPNINMPVPHHQITPTQPQAQQITPAQNTTLTAFELPQLSSKPPQNHIKHQHVTPAPSSLL